MILVGNRVLFYSRSDGKYHYKSELPKTLQPYVGMKMDGCGVDVKTFFRKLRNAIIKLLPEGYELYSWNPNWYTATGIVKDSKGRFSYISFSDIRHWQDEWVEEILIKTMSHEKNWSGGYNQKTDLLNLGKDIAKLRRDEDEIRG